MTILDSSQSGKIHQINYLSVKKIISQIDFDHFIFASTSHVYKPQDRIIKETDQTKPQNFYAMTKLKAENEIIKNLKNYSILRIFNIYGSKQRDGYIYKDLELKIIKNINLDIKNNYRDFVHVNDVARSINHIIKKKLKGIFNISSGKQKSFKQIVNHLLKKNNFKYSNTVNFTKSNNKSAEELDEDFATLINTLDIDGDGEIGYSEFIAGTMEIKHWATAERMEQAFHKLDRDHSEALELAEIKVALGGIDDATSQDILERFDKNNDGKIDMEEFKAMMLENEANSRKYLNKKFTKTLTG